MTDKLRLDQSPHQWISKAEKDLMKWGVFERGSEGLGIAGVFSSIEIS